jgi:hypothetical protein
MAAVFVCAGHLYVKSDVYGFGVVLLEILTGLRAPDTDRPAAQHSLVDWAKSYLADRRKLARLIDPRLEGQYSSRGAQRAAQLTLRCLAADHKNRPSMNEVVAVLEEIGSMSRPGTTRPDGSASPHPAARSGHGQRPGSSGSVSDGAGPARPVATRQEYDNDTSGLSGKCFDGFAAACECSSQMTFLHCFFFYATCLMFFLRKTCLMFDLYKIQR